MMNKYRDKSDFEINKAVAENVGIIDNLYIAEFYGEVIWNVSSNDIYNGFTSKKGWAFDPCNNPADAMPIVIENRISIESRFNGHYDEWYASLQTNKILIDATGTNYYRVAMEVFLMMKEAENENNNNS
ncbi:phage protein NinX family protein [Morganella morganii]|nr:DUF2591 family protein [Morganella morganii]EKW3937930.1 DUF2591 family protein [Morganella morganii]